MEEMRAHKTGVLALRNHGRQPTPRRKFMKFSKLTPNLVVTDVARSVAFYRDNLGMEIGMSVPDEPPYVFASVVHGSVEIFFNATEAVRADFPQMLVHGVGGALTLYLEVDDVDRLHLDLSAKGVTIVMEPKTQFYGMREFMIADPDGWLLMFAQKM
jgi:uncharacterized glyoxalase superfamily protein PhnB